MDKYFHPILYNGYNYLSMLGLKLNHVNKSDQRMIHCSRACLSKACTEIAGKVVIDCLAARIRQADEFALRPR